MLSLTSEDYDVIEHVAKRKKKATSNKQLVGGQVKLLSGKTAPWWPNVKRAATRRRINFCSGQKSHQLMIQKGYFLATIDSNAVTSLFPDILSIPKERVCSIGQ